jgi:hypothetical protein
MAIGLAPEYPVMRSRHVVLVAFLAASVSSSVLAASPIGNTVQASTTVSASGRTLQKSSPVFLNDVIRSNATGVGQFIFDDGTKLAIGPSASLTVDKAIYKGKSAGRTSIQASKGAFRYISGAFSGHKVSTPYGTIGIRGTAFDFTIRNGKVYILLFRGAVDFCRGGSCKTLKRSCDYLVAGGGRISDPQPLAKGLDSGLNVGEAFPLAVNQSRLTSKFRQATRNCLTRVVRREQGLPTRAAAIDAQPTASEPPAPGPAPEPAGRTNKGFGNGEESNGTPEANNPGRGHGGPHSNK